MGGDGGVIATCRTDLREAKKATYIERKNKTEVSITRYTTCALSNLPLGKSVVCCRLGNLFDKVVLIERMQAKALPEQFQHIRKLRDMKAVIFTPNPEKQNTTRNTDLNYWAPSVQGAWVCPVTGQEVNGRNRFCVIWPTGVILSRRCLQEIPHKELFEIAKCEFSAEDIIYLNPPEDELGAMKEAAATWKQAREAERKQSRRKRKAQAKRDSAAIGHKGLAKKTDKERDDVKKARKRIKGRKKAKAAAARTSSTLMDSTASMTKEARDLVDTAKKANKVYNSLFVKDPSRLVNLKGGGNEKNNLFCRMATHRYLT